MSDFEKLGAFYLGRSFDPDKQVSRPDPFLYDARDLITHALVVGMTGSGKTGLSVVLLEEAAIDAVPALIIDPKGDMGNLLLSFPALRPEDFRPWIDESEAGRAGLTPDDYAARTARSWKEGLGDWGQGGDRIRRFRSAVDLAIYTPGSDAGLSVNILRSLSAPPKEVARDSDAIRERIVTAVSGLLGLIGRDADPIRSREHILVSNVLSRAWTEGRDMDIGGLIRAIQSPPFQKLGVMDLESIFPAKDRSALAMDLNNLLAAEAFSPWTQGEPLDIQAFLYTKDGRPRLSIFSLAHLSDAERMFFVTLLLNEVVTWIRGQSGTGSLRAILYMDEIFGYFPPNAQPPSKPPMLTLLKQARAFGLGIVLATQNPVDLDYKGLANTGTWFLGRLQTERDKDRVLEGLEGASPRAFDKRRLDVLLSSLGKRVFLMHNVHEEEPILFQTRWALSYLRGPLLRDQVARLMEPRKPRLGPGPAEEVTPKPPAIEASAHKPALPSTLSEVYLPLAPAPRNEPVVYRPHVLGRARLHYVSTRAGVDYWEETATLVPLEAAVRDAAALDWSRGAPCDADILEEGLPTAAYAELPAVAMRPDSYATWSKSYAGHLYRTRVLTLWKTRALDLMSRPEETEGEFRIRAGQLLRERRDEEIEKLRRKFAPESTKLRERIDTAERRLHREESEYEQQKIQTAISFGATLLGALTGRKWVSTSNVGRARTAARSAGRAARERQDIDRAQQEIERLRDHLTHLEEAFATEAERLRTLPAPGEIELEEVSIPPRKTDITVHTMALAWSV